MKNITQDELQSLLHYEPETGVFSWKVSPNRRIKVGSVAGTPQNRGYVNIKISGKLYLAHRLAFLYMTGEFPPDDVDHANGIKNDNYWSNLRQATRSENNHNLRLSSANTSGVKGVTWNKPAGKWRAVICIQGKNRHLGYFTTIEAAETVVRSARIELHGAFANHGN